MNLQDLQDEWANDSKIDELTLGTESARCSMLHSKYMNFLIQARFNAKKAENKLNQSKRLLTRYFNGLMTKDELRELDWPQYQGTKPLKGELLEMIEQNDGHIEVSNKHHYARVTEDFLESVIKEIGNRTWHIKNCIRWTEWTNGEH